MEVLKLIKVNIRNEDREVLSKIDGYLIVTNHPSLIDIVILISLLNNPVCLAKGKLTRNIFMRFIILNAFINNSTNPKELIEKSSEVLSKGYNLIIFPEGTRTIKDAEKKFQRGAAYIALEKNYSILCVHIDMPVQFLGKHQKWYDVGENTILYNIKIKKTITPAEVTDKSKSKNINARHLTELIKNNIEK